MMGFNTCRQWSRAFLFAFGVALINFGGCASSAISSLPKPQKALTIEGLGAIELSSDKVVDGSLLWIHLSQTSPRLKARAVLKEQEAEFFPVPTGYLALIGVPHSTEEGRVGVEVVWEKDGKLVRSMLGLDVVSGKYASEALRVDPRLVNPPAKAMKRINRESAIIGQLYRTITPKRYWDGQFKWPLKEPIQTSPYGTKRTYNGETRNMHSGLDLKAAIGTPIVAPAPGKVVLARDLYFTGKTVFLDHGYGLFTVYAHMSKIQVKVGQEVTVGRRLGRAGMTGRSSGPHLHWGAVINRVKINPMGLIEVIR